MTHKQRSTTRSGKAHRTANGPSLREELRSRTTAIIHNTPSEEYPDISVSLHHADRLTRSFPLLERRVARACELLRNVGGTANARAADALTRALESVRAPLFLGKIIIYRDSRPGSPRR